MSTKVIGIVVAVVVVAGGAYFFMSKGQSMPEGATGTPVANTVSSPMSLKELIAGGESQQCTFSDDASGTQMQGIVYVGGGKVRSDFTSVAQGQTMSTHMIADGADMYTWVDGMTNGFKMSMAAQKPADNSTQQQGLDSDKKVDYHCSPWSADVSKFVLPTAVTFQDMAAMMQGAMKGSGAPSVPSSMQGNAMQCKTCDQLPAAQKGACRTALKCQ